GAIGAPHHRVLGLQHQRRARPRVERRPHALHEGFGRLRQRQHRDSARIVGILVNDPFAALAGKMLPEGRGVGAAAEGHQLHEQASVGALLGAVLEPPFLAEIRGLDLPASLFHHRFTLSGPASTIRESCPPKNARRPSAASTISSPWYGRCRRSRIYWAA